MQPVKRKKPLRNHVRTGCITCKRRRVKCPEERPHCSRCIKAGFVCSGYAIPTTWIFKSSTESQSVAHDAHYTSSTRRLSTASSTSVSSPSHGTRSSSCATSILSPLQLGNSDPFNALPIRLGPCETHLLRMYQVLVSPRFDQLGSRYVLRLPAIGGWTHYGIRLEDEAAGYGLLARCAALENWKLNGHHAAPSTSLIKYVSKSQAALHRKLSILDGFETPEIVYSVMWTSAILAMADLLMGSLNVHLYSRAMCIMIVRYIELTGHDVQAELILYPLYMDAIRSLLTITRPNIDMVDWFPRIFQKMWNRAAALFPVRKGTNEDICVHPDIKDTVIQDFILSQHEDKGPYLDLHNAKMSYKDTMLVANTVRTKELIHYGRVLDNAIDALECLRKSVCIANRTPKLIQDQIARVYVSFSVLLWMNLTSPTGFTSNAMLDSTPGLLRHLEMAITKSISHQNSQPDRDQPYAVAKLWGLYVGVHAECRRKDMKRDLVCGDWFLNAFRKQAKSMQIYSWQHAVTSLRQILYNDRMKPHISEWWHQIFPSVEPESDIA